MKWLIQAILTLVSIAYPLLWYFGRQWGWFDALALGMAVLWLTRGCIQRDRAQKAVSFVLAAFFCAVWLLQKPQSMYWYPVWVNLLMLLVFGVSLLGKQSLIERLARLQDPNLPPEAVPYTRRVTQIWCVFFIFNGSIAALLVWLQRFDWWAWYTGIIAYILMGLLLGGEWLYRKKILRV